MDFVKIEVRLKDIANGGNVSTPAVFDITRVAGKAKGQRQVMGNPNEKLTANKFFRQVTGSPDG